VVTVSFITIQYLRLGQRVELFYAADLKEESFDFRKKYRQLADTPGADAALLDVSRSAAIEQP
jgi:hypothetical protein